MGVEIWLHPGLIGCFLVMPREGHGSRNLRGDYKMYPHQVMPREGHGSRNCYLDFMSYHAQTSCPARGMGVEIGSKGAGGSAPEVMPREGHGSRNTENQLIEAVQAGHAPRGAWE